MFCFWLTLLSQGFHSCWFELRTQLLALAGTSGAPVMRHMFFHYWQDQSVSDLSPLALSLMQTQVLQRMRCLIACFFMLSL
jgi:hypothetical protein